MAFAICIACGAAKRHPQLACRHCGYSPTGDNVAMAKSLMLSTLWLNGEEEPKLSKRELRCIQAKMANGVPPTFDGDELARLVAEKEGWDRAGAMPWWRFILLLLAILGFPAALLAIALLIRYLRYATIRR